MIYLSADHAGFALKERVKTWLTELGVAYQDLGPQQFNPGDDYPILARPVAEKVSAGEGEGILICDTGEGMAIAANKFPGVRAALVTDDLTAARSKEHNDSNILVLGSELQGEEDAKRFLQIWLT
ncbi:MAG TPA: RpiB/LacA/LacB family sugar-phosphate isomerase, partial [Patescibacteria group bacterium]|nr:RpiB/LacA/LacB family sugar-phosphate isomerase [Patescibacteria group bacterium]